MGQKADGSWIEVFIFTTLLCVVLFALGAMFIGRGRAIGYAAGLQDACEAQCDGPSAVVDEACHCLDTPEFSTETDP